MLKLKESKFKLRDEFENDHVIKATLVVSDNVILGYVFHCECTGRWTFKTVCDFQERKTYFFKEEAVKALLDFQSKNNMAQKEILKKAC